MNANIPFRERIACTIPEACIATGLGRSKLYAEIAAGRVATRKVGRRVLVIVESLEHLIGGRTRMRGSDGASSADQPFACWFR
jgi:hypothetical protein